MSLDCCIFVAKICNKEDMDTKQARPQLSFTEAVKSTWQNAILCPISMANHLSIADYFSDKMPIVCES